MNELFLEIQEDVRRERAEKLWRSFGRFAVWASVVVVFLTILFVVWQDHTRSVGAEKTALLLKGNDRMALEDYKGAVPIFDSLASDKDSPHYGIAMLRKAQAQTLGGDAEGAKQTYAELSKTNSEFAELAKIKTPAGDEAPADISSPFYFSFTEYRAWDLLAQGKKSEAAELFAAIASNDLAPPSQGARAQEVLQHIAPEKFAAGRLAKDNK